MAVIEAFFSTRIINILKKMGSPGGDQEFIPRGFF